MHTFGKNRKQAVDTAKTLTLLDLLREALPGKKGEQALPLLEDFVREKIREDRLSSAAEVVDRVTRQVEREVARETKVLATKDDLHVMERNMHKMENRLVFWIIGGVATILIAIATLAYGTNQGNRTSAPQQQPSPAGNGGPDNGG